MYPVVRCPRHWPLRPLDGAKIKTIIGDCVSLSLKDSLRLGDWLRVLAEVPIYIFFITNRLATEENMRPILYFSEMILKDEKFIEILLNTEVDMYS